MQISANLQSGHDFPSSSFLKDLKDSFSRHISKRLCSRKSPYLFVPVIKEHGYIFISSEIKAENLDASQGSTNTLGAFI